MKAFLPKTTMIFLMLVIMIALSKVKAQPTCGCPDRTVTALDLDTFIGNYDALFRTSNQNKMIFTKWIYLSRNYFLFLDSFFSTREYNTYQGVKFLFVDYNTIIDSEQNAHKNQVLFNISAAIDSRHIDKNALLNFDLTVDYLWSPTNSMVYFSPAFKMNPSTKSFISRYDMLRVNSTAAGNHRSNRPANKFTKELFVCKEVIRLIADELRANTALGGVKCLFGSYNKKMPLCVNLLDIRQFTLIFAPVPDQNTTVQFTKLNYFKTSNFLDGKYNHGSLCPNDCSQ